MRLEKAFEIQKLMRIREERDLNWLAEVAKGCQRIVEIGTYLGASTRAMLDNSQARIWCIDSWCGGLDTSHGLVPSGKDFRLFLKHIQDIRDRIVILKMYSRDAAGLLPNGCFDMVYIDADHSYDAVRFDILHYASLVKPGGLLCGHDYDELPRPGLVRAVKELITTPQEAGQLIWWTRREEGWLREKPMEGPGGCVYRADR